MIIHNTIFSIPIYVCSKSEFLRRIEQKRENAKKKYHSTFAYKKMKIPYEPIDEKAGWKYNKIIGWIEFYLNGQTIKAEYWFVKAKKISINIKIKNFEYKNKIMDVSQTHHKTNKEIVDDIKFFLGNCQNGEYVNKFKNFYIDTEELLQLLKVMDIKKLVTTINKKRLA